jgi:hypothetical protein
MSDLRKQYSLDHLLSANEPIKNVKYKQDERVYFKISETVAGFGVVAGDYDLLIILKPEKQLGDYSHIYVTRTQILQAGPNVAPQVVEEVDDGL